MSDGSTTRRAARARIWFGRLTLVGLIVWPYLAWAAGPASLFDDDLIRVGSLRRSAVVASLFRPFNEHVAPLFELIGWGAWWATGQQVDRIAAGFQATALASGAVLALGLGVLVRLELRSVALGFLAAGLFSWQVATSEVALWYSASSFGWAAAATLGAVIAVRQAGTSARPGRRTVWLAGAALMALAAPLCSAVGVLAGPLAMLRLSLVRLVRRADAAEGRPMGWIAVLVPLIGTLIFGAVVLAGSGRSAVAGTVRTQLDLGAAAWAGLQAPILVLVPAIGGLGPLAGRLPAGFAAFGTAIIGLLIVERMVRRSEDHAMLVLALAWIIGGYGLTYAPRVHPGDAWIFAVGRYHLFPMIGAILALVTLVRSIPVPRFWASRRAQTVGVGLGLLTLVAVGWAWFAPTWEAAAAAYRFPGEPASLRATLRLEAACQAEGVPLAQAIRVIAPTRTGWFPRPAGFHPMLYLFGLDGPDAHRSDAEVGPSIVARLSEDDREAIWQALDVRRAGLLTLEAAQPGERDHHIAAAGEGSELAPGGRPIYWREFAIDSTPGEIRAIGLRRGAAQRQEVWWLGRDGQWTPERSVFWEMTGRDDWLILDRLPHWRGEWGRRVRLVRRDRPWPASSSQVEPHSLAVRSIPTNPGSR